MSTAVMSTSSHLDGALQKRKRSSSPLSEDEVPPTSRRRSRSPPSTSTTKTSNATDSDLTQKADRERQLTARVAAMELEKVEKPRDKLAEAQAEFAKLVGSRSGGVYMPPARLRALQQAASNDKTSPEYQRLSWDALRKSITGIVNRVNITNIKQVVPELFAENLIRGRGLFSRSVMKAQAASLPFTPVFAALVAIINSKLPQVGELVLTRLISQFRRSFKRNDKTVCHSSTTFIGHLVNQSVAHEIIALQILVLLLERPTDDSIEIAVGFMREVGAFLAENSPKANATVFERFRAVLNEGTISQRVQFMIEVLMQVRKDRYKDNPILPEGLDLVEEDEQITHQIQLEEELQVQEGLNIFKFDPSYLENEEKYKSIKAEILGEDSDSGSGSDEDSENQSDDEEQIAESKEGIEDRTETNLVNLRRTIYLTIMNALNYEEAVHKLLKVQLDEGQELEMVNMIIECCSQERSYSTFYGLIGERFSKLNRVWTDCFETAFGNYYTTVHRYETNRLRNIARFFGHLLASDSISWMVFECVKINEDDTTSSSRIFIKILMNEMMESMGLKTLAERFKDPEVKRGCEGMFPMDIPKNTRFAINYFTSIGLGVVTEGMREYLQNAPKLIMEQRRALAQDDSSSDSDSSDSDSDSSSSDSDSESEAPSVRSRRDTRRKRHSPTPTPSPPRHKTRGGSPRGKRSPSPPPRRRGDSPPRHRDSENRRRDSPPPRRASDRREPSIDRRPERRGPPPSLSPSRRRAPLPSRSRSPSRSRGSPMRRDSRRSPVPPRPGRGERDSRSPGRRYSRSSPPPPTRGGGGGGGRLSRSPPPYSGRGRQISRSPEPFVGGRSGGGGGGGGRPPRSLSRSPPPVPPSARSPRSYRDRERERNDRGGGRRDVSDSRGNGEGRGGGGGRERSPPPPPRREDRNGRDRRFSERERDRGYEGRRG